MHIIYLIITETPIPPMDGHDKCPGLIQEDLNTKQRIKTGFVFDQHELDVLDLDGSPRLVQLSKNFTKFVLPLLKAKYEWQMDEYLTMDPEKIDPCIVKGTDIFIDQVLARHPIPVPCNLKDDHKEIPSMDMYFKQLKRNKEVHDAHAFRTAYDGLILDLQREAKWDSDWENVNSMLTTLATLKLSPQFPHTDYPRQTIEDSASRPLPVVHLSCTSGFHAVTRMCTTSGRQAE